MRVDLLDLLCCPACQGDLTLEDIEESHGEIWAGAAACQRCGASYPVQEGMPHLYVEDELWQPKAREAEGWVTLHKEQGIYEPSEAGVDLRIPYYPQEPWPAVAQSFDLALEKLDLTGEELILDLGAGRGWAAKAFALRGCRVVAVDILADTNIGLGRARALMQDAGVYFERLLADGERLPFRPGQFDLVFCSATLHHASDLSRLLSNIHRVLKPGGRLCAIQESCISVADNEARALRRSAGEELEAGINESCPNLLQYVAALQKSQLYLVDAFPAFLAQDNRRVLKEQAQDSGALFPDLAPAQPLPALRGALRFAGKRVLALLNGSYFRARQFMAEHPDDVPLAFLLWSGGNMFLLARKQEGA